MATFMDLDAPTLITGVRVLDPGQNRDVTGDVFVHAADPAGPIARLATDADRAAATRRVDGAGLWATPGLVDLQVHFREPGFEHKETLASGSRAAFAGGFTHVVVMPNTKPALHTPGELEREFAIAQTVDGVGIHVAAAATHDLQGDHLTDHGALKAAGAVAITDDGMPVMRDNVMRGSLEQCAAHDLLFMQHAEDIHMTGHRPMNAGPTADQLGIDGQPADAEGVLVERDLALVAETGARYHVLHTSTARSLNAIRAAKAQGLPVSCEASPHHLLLTDAAVAGPDGADTNKKMNPPLKGEQDRQALIAALADGTVDAIATDHAPHSADEKAKSFADAPFGVVGLGTALSGALRLVHQGHITDAQAIALLTSGPARVLRMQDTLGTMATGDLALIDPTQTWTVGPDTLHGQSTNSAFLGETFKGQVLATFKAGRQRYQAAALAPRIHEG